MSMEGRSDKVGNESSVLFSLAMLTQQAEPQKPVSATPGADVAMLSVGDAFAPALVAPVIPELRDAHRASRAPVAIAAVAAVLVVGSGLFAAVRMARPLEHATVAVAPTIAASATPVVVTTETPVKPVASVAPPTTHVATPPPRSQITSTPIPSATQSAPACEPSESPLACNIRLAAGGDKHAAFDPNAASRALSAVDVSTCKRDMGGTGHVKITFESSGTATAATVDSSSLTPAVTRCIEQRYRTAKVPAFAGSPITVGKSFTLR